MAGPEDEYGPSTYGDRIAEVYDQLFGLPEDARLAAEALAKLAGPGPVLELGIGTGRVALPLKEGGVEVHGVDASEAMVAKLREKPGGADIPVVMGDFARVDELVTGPYSMVYIPFNTFFALLTQEDQLACMRGVAGLLTEDGVFVIRAFVPDMTYFHQGSRVAVTDIQTDRAVLNLGRVDPVKQEIVTQLLILESGQISTYPVKLRYAWPAELDLMARVVGLRLRERWAGWGGEPFTSSSPGHVSIYEPAGT